MTHSLEQIDEAEEHVRAGRLPEAIRTFDAALAGWEGPAFVDLREIEALHVELVTVDRRLADALCRSGELHLAVGDHDAALAAAERVVSFDPTDERAHRLAIGVHLTSGDDRAAASALDRCREALRAIGVSPDETTAALERRLDDRLIAS